MPAEASHPAFDLPVYDPETVVATTFDLNDSTRLAKITNGGTAETFVRAAHVALFNPEQAPQGLTEVLKKTDQELEEVAELCEARVISHQWGLHPIHPLSIDHRDYLPASFTRKSVDLPEEHILVAEVEFVKGAMKHLPKFLYEKAMEGVAQYRERRRGQYQLMDIRIGQFVTNERSELCLVDIEPQLCVYS